MQQRGNVLDCSSDPPPSLPLCHLLFIVHLPPPLRASPAPPYSPLRASPAPPYSPLRASPPASSPLLRPRPPPPLPSGPDPVQAAGVRPAGMAEQRLRGPARRQADGRAAAAAAAAGGTPRPVAPADVVGCQLGGCEVRRGKEMGSRVCERGGGFEAPADLVGRQC